MTTSASAGAAAAKGFSPDNPTLAQRMAGMLHSPARTFRVVIADSRWQGVLAASTVIAVLAAALVMQTASGRQALVDQWERTSAAFGHEVDDSGYARLEELSRYASIYAGAAAVVAVPGVTVATAGLLFLLRGGKSQSRRVPFPRLLAVVTHASVVLALRQVVAAALTYTRETTASALSLGAWFPGLDAASPAARALGFVDVFVLWWAVLLAMGTAALFQWRTRTVALGFAGIYLALALLTAALLAAAGGTA